MHIEITIIFGLISTAIGIASYLAGRAKANREAGEEAGSQRQVIANIETALATNTKASNENGAAVQQMKDQFVEKMHGLDKRVDLLTQSVDLTGINIARFENNIGENIGRIEGQMQSLEQLTTSAIASASEANAKADKLHKRVDRIEDKIKEEK